MVLYDGNEQDDNGKQGGNPPLLENQDLAVAVWINEDVNGDYYLRVDLPFVSNFNIFVKDKFKGGFNDVIDHYISEGELTEEAIQGGDNDE